MNTPRFSKALLLQACMRKQDQLISDFEREISHLQEAITLRQDMPSQEEERASSQNELLVRLEHEVLFLKNERSVLELLEVEKVCDRVELGAVVVTDQQVFFISTSVDVVSIEGLTFFGISTKAPIYAVMKDKHALDTFDYGGVRYRILEVY
jgi:hypothetical protein